MTNALNLITVARNLGVEKKDRKACNIGVEKFLLQTLALHNLSQSDVINVALEKYLREKGYLSDSSINLLNSVSLLEKQIFKNR